MQTSMGLLRRNHESPDLIYNDLFSDSFDFLDVLLCL